MKTYIPIASILAALVLPSAAAGQTCDIPESYANQVVVVESDTLVVGFATDKHVYSPSDTASFYLVVTNAGSDEFFINWSMDPQNAVFVHPTTCDSVYRPDCYASSIFYYPTFIYFMSSGTRLQPGECRVWEVSWDIDDWDEEPPADGIYNVFGGMFRPFYDIAPDEGFQVPRGGARLTIQIDSAVPVELGSWGRIKALYR
jgi:hypothetical protein